VAASSATDFDFAVRGLPRLAHALDARAEREGHAIQLNTALSCGLVFLAIAAGYGTPRASSYVFFAVIPLFVQQLFATFLHTRRLELECAARAARSGFPPPRIPTPFLDGAALAIRSSYLMIFACFDSAWLFHAYIAPSAAGSWQLYLARLAIGPISGLALVLFTVVFWFVYPVLFVYGDFIGSTGRPGDTSAVSPLLSASSKRAALSVRALARDGTVIRLNGYHLAQPGGQPLILWPGFFQNASVYDLIGDQGTFAEYLHSRGFDLWLFHPRGTGGSSGRQMRASLDDYAATDLSAIVAFVAAKSSKPPVLVGHSQGGITAILNLMGAEFRHDGSVMLSDLAGRERQQKLLGLVTLGAFPSFVSEHETGLQRFVRQGIPIPLGPRVLRIPLPPLLALVHVFRCVGVPIDVRWRQALIASSVLRALLCPLFLVLDAVARLQAWEFLFHIPNVTVVARRRLFFLTIETTFTDILQQFYLAVREGRMCSSDGKVDYSEEYGRLRLPVAFITMQLDGFVDEPSLVKLMFDRVSSEVKEVIRIPGIGHEDFFMNANYYAEVSRGIEGLVRRVTTGAPTQAALQTSSEA
jgi:pimeloyl-ACP methyl ester carboxylesterase